LDGFYANCLRRIQKIPAAFHSRVSNAIVLKNLDAVPLSRQLLGHQLKLFGKLAIARNENLGRHLSLEPGGVQPRRWNNRRNVGRPRLRWTSCVHAHALSIAGGSAVELQRLLRLPHQRQWKALIRKFVAT
jgi:hypothetical protein